MSPTAAVKRNDWYWGSPVNIHWDNHGNSLGQGISVDEIVKMFAGINADMIQVSARSGHTTYPSQIGVPNPKLAGYDTLATSRGHATTAHGFGSTSTSSKNRT